MKGFPVLRKAVLRRNSVSTSAYVLFSIYLCSLRIIITCVVGNCRLCTAEVWVMNLTARAWVPWLITGSVQPQSNGNLKLQRVCVFVFVWFLFYSHFWQWSRIGFKLYFQRILSCVLFSIVKYKLPSALFSSNVKLNSVWSALEGLAGESLEVPEACGLHPSPEVR